MNINFRNIRADFPNGQRGAFEELVCQLAFRELSDPSKFKRIEGAGGDGGVECVEITASGVIGYQAKFYTEVAEIDWRAIEKSVKTALHLYPDLIRYFIAIPCDFTGRKNLSSGRVTEGAWGNWEKYSQQWEAEAAKRGRAIDFVPWTEFDLRNKLIQTKAEGLRAYWFGETEFSATWLRQHVQSAIASLDDRYNPQDHVEVHLQDVFDVLVKHPRAVAAVTEKFQELRRFPIPRFSDNHVPLQELAKTAENGLVSLLAHETDLREEPWQSWDPTRWNNAVSAMRKALVDLLNAYKKNGPYSEYDYHQLLKLHSSFNSLEDKVTNSVLLWGRAGSILFHGTAGAGKSHLLARIADCFSNEDRPVIFWVGQQLRDQALWPQLLQRLGLSTITQEEFLGALEAVAQARKTRAILLVDAINEGAGVHLWRAEISGFISKIQAYPSLAVVLTCRSEYLNYLVPKGTLTKLHRIEVRGFETDEEQSQAARVYLDRRGISRPATPWLAPEFVNPLFLRSCCNALERAGLREFPKGLAGTKAIMRFYLDSVGRNLGAGRDGSDELMVGTNNSLVGLARAMGLQRRSYLSLHEASNIVTESFKPYLPPESLTWLDVLRRNGLIRLDPNPDLHRNGKPLEEVNVLRFSFQRFQDHLMADALLAEVSDVETAIWDNGPLAFVREGKEFAWEWRGLIEALTIQIPERFGRELVDVLPGGMRQWWDVYFVQDSFLESIRWRSAASFSDRTLALFNQISHVSQSRLSILVELSASIDHPWNAEMIHRNLLPKPMYSRDAFWADGLNIESSDEGHAVHRLIDWCLRPEIKLADPRTIDLCSITLTWLLTLSNRLVRDRATKSLTNLFLVHPGLFKQLVARFHGVDDLYLWERVFQAAFGAASNDPNLERLLDYAKLAMEEVFSRDQVPENLLLRDCARGLIQLADHYKLLPSNFPVRKSRPPYGSRPPRFTATQEQVERLAKQTGDNEILHSCNTWGDFGRYEIEPVVGHFTALRLNSSPPITKQKLYNQFLRDVVQPFPGRRTTWLAFQKALMPEIRLVFTNRKNPEPSTTGRKRGHKIPRQAAINTAESEFLQLLTQDERERYRGDALPFLNRNHQKSLRDHRRIDVTKAQLWVARRAYQHGQVSKSFPWDRGGVNYDRSRPQLERLGKKYQWIALDELACKLADNYWMSEYGGDTKEYQYPPDAGFFRDIDPTIIVPEKKYVPESWMREPRIVIEPSGGDSYGWPFSIKRGDELPQTLIRRDQDGSLWLTAYEYQNSGPRQTETDADFPPSSRREEFRFACLALVHRKDRDKFVESIAESARLDIHAWGPREFTDGPYLFEASWRPTWELEMWENDEWNGRAPVAFPVSEYHWESHLDLTLPDGYSEILPSPWLLRTLGLQRNLQLRGTYQDSHGDVQFRSSQGTSDGAVALFKHDFFFAYLKQESLEPVWLYLDERNFIVADMAGAWRRTEGVAWLEGGAVRSTIWHHDQTKKSDKT